MPVVFAPGDKYLYRHIYTVAGIGGILIITGAAVAGRWALSKLQATPSNTLRKGKDPDTHQ